MLRYSFGLLLNSMLILLLVTSPVAALEGTDVWEEGASIEYELDYLGQLVNRSLYLETLYRIDTGHLNVEYTGMDEDKMIFKQTSQTQDVISLLFDNFRTPEVEDTFIHIVDPVTGKNQYDEDLYMFSDTSGWKQGYRTDFTEDLALSLTDSLTRTYIVDSTSTMRVGGDRIKVFDLSIPDVKLPIVDFGIRYNYIFSNLTLRLAADTGVLMAQTFYHEINADLDADGTFEKIIGVIDYSLLAVSISDGVRYTRSSPALLWLVPILMVVALLIRCPSSRYARGQ